MLLISGVEQRAAHKARHSMLSHLLDVFKQQSRISGLCKGEKVLSEHPLEIIMDNSGAKHAETRMHTNSCTCLEQINSSSQCLKGHLFHMRRNLAGSQVDWAMNPGTSEHALAQRKHHFTNLECQALSWELTGHLEHGKNTERGTQRLSPIWG